MQEQHAQPGIQRSMATAVEPHSHSDSYAPLILLGVAVVLAAVLVGWLLVRSDNTQTTPTFLSTGPALVSAAQLERASAALGSPIYWAGPRDGFSYELTVTSSGRVYLRYLPKGVKAGDPRANFLTIGTYRGVPYTSLVDVSGRRRTPAARAAWHRFSVPPTLVSR